MKCDVCDKNISPDNCFTYAEVENSRLCQSCFEAVTAVVTDEITSVETAAMSKGANAPEQSANGLENEYRCHSCGGICDSSRKYCTKCGKELNKSSSHEPFPDNGEQVDEFLTTNPSAIDLPDNEYHCPSCGSSCDGSRMYCTKCGKFFPENGQKPSESPAGEAMGCLGWVLAIIAVLIIALYLVCQNIHFP